MHNQGQYLQNKVVFLPDGSEVSSRTDADFIKFSFTNHQKRITPLASLLNFDCVSKFPLDYMHLVLLGVMKRMLQFITKGPLNCRLSSNQIKQISTKLKSYSGLMPSEFNHQPRGLDDFPHWKATELRQFLLYLGPIFLKGIVSESMYEHFLRLHIALSILLNDSKEFRDHFLGYSRNLLLWFVSKSQDIYGKGFVTYNVHSLIHLCEDVSKFSKLLKLLVCFQV